MCLCVYVRRNNEQNAANVRASALVFCGCAKVAVVVVVVLLHRALYYFMQIDLIIFETNINVHRKQTYYCAVCRMFFNALCWMLNACRAE